MRYGEDELRLPVAIPGERSLPGLEAHNNWMRVFRFAGATGLSLDALQKKMESGEIRDRLVLVTRTPEAGADPSSWGAINRHAWKFDFYEFKPDGGFEHQRRSFPVEPSTGAKIKAGLKGEPAPRPREDELKENTWEFQAALQIMPPATTPNPRFTNDGLHAMGWTLPATSVSMLVLLGALMVALAPDRKSEEDAPAGTPA